MIKDELPGIDIQAHISEITMYVDGLLLRNYSEGLKQNFQVLKGPSETMKTRHPDVKRFAGTVLGS